MAEETSSKELRDYWEAFSKELPLPNLKEILSREIRTEEVDQLLRRCAALKITKVGGDEPNADGQPIKLENASHLYNVYDFGSALIATPVDLYDPDRTLGDATQTAKAMAREAVEKRGWRDISLEGVDIMTKTAWAEVEAINRSRLEAQEKEVAVRGYQPTADDHKALERQMRIKGP